MPGRDYVVWSDDQYRDFPVERTQIYLVNLSEKCHLRIVGPSKNPSRILGVLWPVLIGSVMLYYFRPHTFSCGQCSRSLTV